MTYMLPKKPSGIKNQRRFANEKAKERGVLSEAFRIILRIIYKAVSKKSMAEAIAASVCGIALLLILAIAAAMESGVIAISAGGVFCLVISFVLSTIAESIEKKDN